MNEEGGENGKDEVPRLALAVFSLSGLPFPWPVGVGRQQLTGHA